MERNPDLPPEELEDGVCKVREFFLPQKGSLKHVPESQSAVLAGEAYGDSFL